MSPVPCLSCSSATMCGGDEGHREGIISSFLISLYRSIMSYYGPEGKYRGLGAFLACRTEILSLTPGLILRASPGVIPERRALSTIGYGQGTYTMSHFLWLLALLLLRISSFSNKIASHSV